MTKRTIIGTTAGHTGRDFTGKRQPVSPLPLPLRVLVRSWCDLNGIFMSEDGTHLIWKEVTQGKAELIKLFLSYHKSEKSGKEYVFAKNNHFNRRINVTGMMAVEIELQKLNFDEQTMREFNDNMNNGIQE